MKAYDHDVLVRIDPKKDAEGYLGTIEAEFADYVIGEFGKEDGYKNTSSNDLVIIDSIGRINVLPGQTNWLDIEWHEGRRDPSNIYGLEEIAENERLVVRNVDIALILWLFGDIEAERLYFPGHPYLNWFPDQLGGTKEGFFGADGTIGSDFAEQLYCAAWHNRELQKRELKEYSEILDLAEKEAAESDFYDEA